MLKIMADTESNGWNEWQQNTDFCVQFVLWIKPQREIYIQIDSGEL